MTKFIFITGGVVSSLGKGIVAASLASLLQAGGFSCRLRKLDPYLNIDPGTMNPIQHGEVFVTEDGIETDLDLGHYERFTGVNSHKGDNVTAGRIYSELLKKERRGDYLGGTVQVIPHVTDLIKNFITDSSSDVDFVLCEIGGTVGDIEGLPFFEAIRQLGYELGLDNCLYIHLTLLPYLNTSGEVKTKPTQHSVKELRSIGIEPDILICRIQGENRLSASEKRKIALFCNVKEQAVIEAVDATSIYQVPLNLNEEGLYDVVLGKFSIPYQSPDLTKWQEYLAKANNVQQIVKIAIAGKYIELEDSYKSLLEAISHAATHNNVKAEIILVNTRDIADDEAVLQKALQGADAVLVPGGFGEKGAEGKIRIIQYARENNIPFLGICLGMQCAVLEVARHLCGIKEQAFSTEFTNKYIENPVIGLMQEWDKGGVTYRNSSKDIGGTMRLGSYECKIEQGSLAHQIYDQCEIAERHRHRYEVNINYREILAKAGLKISGLSPDGKLPEIIELENHNFFVAVQFHPEFKSTPFNPHPLFLAFLKTIRNLSSI